MRKQEIEDELNLSLEIISLNNWIEMQFSLAIEGKRDDSHKTIVEEELASAWILAYTESLAQMRREIAPIDEPCYQWLSSWNDIIETSLG